jgi:GWxTD domain-containing protein
MRKVLISLIIIFLLFPSKGLTEKKSIKELPPRFIQWLKEEVVYIITPTEKDVFLQLETDRERELFIEAFWKHRDPIQGTPENEFKKEHSRRINYANYTLGRSVPKPGWKTDRGRIYIILGEPRDIERIAGESQIYNAEIWFYQGLTKYGLPPGFNLVFYQKDGVGEYVLYSPLVDGPQALLTSYFGDQTDYLAAFKTLKKINPSLARVSLSLIPGESARFGRPSLASDILLQNIYRAPQKDLNERYAGKFLMYKDLVEVDYTANYIDNDHSVIILKDPSGIYFVHYVVELMRFSIQQYQDKYSTHLKVNGNVSDLEGKTIYQYEGSISIELSETELKNISYKPFDLYDMFPLLPGTYKFSVIIKNEVSKEFTTLEKDIIIPEDDSTLKMSSLVLGYNLDHVPSKANKVAPFKIGLDQIYHQPKKIFHPQDKLFLVFQILGLTSDLEQRGKLKFEFIKGDEQFLSLTKKVNEYRDRINFKEVFSLQSFPPGYYRIRVTLLDGDHEVLSEEERFEITSASILPRPWVHSKTLSPADDPVYSFILGKQFFSKGKIDKARVKFETAYHKRPDSLRYASGLARAYFALKNYAKTKQILLSIKNQDEITYQVYFLLGKSHQALGELDQAVSFYNEAISHFGINMYLLNSLGECYYRLGSEDEALAAWEKSLEINPNQPEIKKKVKAIKK